MLKQFNNDKVRKYSNKLENKHIKHIKYKYKMVLENSNKIDKSGGSN